MKHVPVQHPSNEELFAYRDGELAGDKRLLIEAHVVSCQSCRELVDGMSAIESDLKRRPDDVGDEYYARMTDSVLAKIDVKHGAKALATGAAGGAKAAEGARRPAEDVPRIERRRPDVDLDAEGERRRPIFPWFGVVGTGAAAAAVLVVVVMLAQRQGEWVRAPRPVATGGPEEEQAVVPGDSGFGERENAPPGLGTQPEAKEKAGLDDLAREAKNQAPLQSTAPLEKQDEALRQERAAGVSEGDAVAMKRAKNESQTFTEGEVGADKKMAAAKDASPAPVGEALSDARVQQAPSAAVGSADAAGAKVAGGPPTEPYAALLRAHGLPPVFDPARVDRDALLRAENDLRYFYMSGRAETDSARVRLYLAEAARAKADPADSAAVEAVIHHYWRAIRLSRQDPAVSAMAWRRLGEYKLETGRAP
ncbi:MAG TPA: zf-HC2 domain-containing protein [Candidatus Eisenbacteria bacterium]|nr:zf-HC2 domain-containing protein [Candidatus Eisenbacteria bacterium]